MLKSLNACGRRATQVAQPEAESPHGGEVTEAALAAREADGAASIVALYASLLIGLLVSALGLYAIQPNQPAAWAGVRRGLSCCPANTLAPLAGSWCQCM